MGHNGINPMDQLRDRDKCKASPTKHQYHDSQEAWKAAGQRSNETGLEIVAYACPDCGFFHLTKKVKGSDVVVKAPVGITTGALRKKTEITRAYPERTELSEPNPETLPLVPMNRAAKNKVLDEFLVSKESVTTAEICDLLGVTFSTVGRDYMKPRGWVNSRGRNARWMKESAEVKPIIEIGDLAPKPIVSITPKDPAVAALYKHREDEKELSASIARHPAGKAIPPKPDNEPWHHEYVSAPQRLILPISNHDGTMRNIGILVPGPLTEVEWAQMNLVLIAMKPALVQEKG